MLIARFPAPGRSVRARRSTQPRVSRGLGPPSRPAAGCWRRGAAEGRRHVLPLQDRRVARRRSRHRWTGQRGQPCGRWPRRRAPCIRAHYWSPRMAIR